MDQELTLRIILESPPAGVDFGVQSGRGNDYETIQKQRSGSDDLSFEFTVKLKEDRGATPIFLGPIVQGPPAQRFVYLDIGTYAGQLHSRWGRRLKIPLAGVNWEMTDRVLSKSGWTIETRVPGTGKDGGPTCGTVKPFAGWRVAPV